ncbi:cytotoxic and regulatory T-cell molecule isoform X1 [Sebastes fasciatus]|uniref:cytotoxic and regulatory T-cell molecule isoform X1 n=1 Tax=Sebastes fasciatus TaxID=394691 RepID=UPI003D9E1292
MSEMELKLQLSVFVLLIQVSLVVCQRVTLKKGQTLNLSCPVTNAHKTNVDWKNPDGYIMFFNRNQGEDHISSLQDKRYSITKLSESEFAISISNITFKDGGNYTCTHYGDRPTEMKVEVTVLGFPKMSVTKHEGQFFIKCTAEGNQYPPQISWKLDQGPEILGHAQVLHEDKKYVSTDMLRVRSVENRVTVKCLVHHPALHSQHLMNFLKIGREFTKPWHTTTASSTTARPQGSTEGQRTTTGWVRHGRTTAYLSTRGVNEPSSDSSIRSSTVPSNGPNMVTSSGLPLNTSDDSTTSVLSGSTRRRNDTISNTTSTTDWASVSEPTETISNHTEGNGTGSSNDPNTQRGSEGSSSLLVFLVTFLIFCLLVVVIFFAIKLRRAHMAWKRENEDSVPSEESSKSKSSQEERNAQGQRRRGLFHTAFTQYVVEKPAVITSVINTAATERENIEQTSQPQTLEQTLVRSDIKETEL